MKAHTVVLGLGNPIMTDEGVGVALIRRLANQAASYPEVEFIEAGTGGMKLIYMLEGRRKAVLIDCAFMKTEPGTLQRFTLEQVQSTKSLADLSLHEGDLLQILRQAQQLGMCPPEVVIFGIEPERLAPGQTLTPTLAAGLNQYSNEILAELKGLRQDTGSP